MKFTPALFAAVACAVATARIHAQCPNWGNDVFGDFSGRIGVTLDNIFTFEPDSFFGGFVPAVSNIDPWILNREECCQDGTNDDAGFFMATVYGLNDFPNGDPISSSPSFAGLDACIWIRADENPVEGSELMLTRATNRAFPQVDGDCCEPDVIDWSVSDPAFGSIPDSEEFFGATTTGLQTFSFVPEPASSLLSAVAGGFLVLRRRRSAL